MISQRNLERIERILGCDGQKDAIHDLYNVLHDPLSETPTVALCGAGTSMPLRPDWRGLLERVLVKIREHAATEDPLADHEQEFLEEASRRLEAQSPALAESYLSVKLPNRFRGAIKAEIGVVPADGKSRRLRLSTELQRILAALPLSSYLTTNFDTGLSNAVLGRPGFDQDFDRLLTWWQPGTRTDIKSSEKDIVLDIGKGSEATVFFLHGNYRHQESIYSTDQKMQDSNPGYFYFDLLRCVYLTSNLLSIGYSFDQNDSISHVMESVQNSSASVAKELKRFRFIPCKSPDEPIDTTPTSALGFTPIRYVISDEGPNEAELQDIDPTRLRTVDWYKNRYGAHWRQGEALRLLTKGRDAPIYWDRPVRFEVDLADTAQFHFAPGIGRFVDEEIRALSQQGDGAARIVCYWGAGGAGKSSLIQTILEHPALCRTEDDSSGRKTTGLFAWSFYDESTSAASSAHDCMTALDGWIDSNRGALLGGDVDYDFGAANAATRIADAVCKSPIILVLDGVERILERLPGVGLRFRKSADDLLWILQRVLRADTANCLVLVSSRQFLSPSALVTGQAHKQRMRCRKIKPWGEDDAYSLLQELLPTVPRSDEIGDLFKIVGTSPLNIRVLAVAMRTALPRLGMSGAGSEAFHAQSLLDEIQNTVKAWSFSGSEEANGDKWFRLVKYYDRIITPDQRRLLSILSLSSGPMEFEAVKALYRDSSWLSDQPIDPLASVLRALNEQGLLHIERHLGGHDNQGRYGTHTVDCHAALKSYFRSSTLQHTSETELLEYFGRTAPDFVGPNDHNELAATEDEVGRAAEAVAILAAELTTLPTARRLLLAKLGNGKAFEDRGGYDHINRIMSSFNRTAIRLSESGQSHDWLKPSFLVRLHDYLSALVPYGKETSDPDDDIDIEQEWSPLKLEDSIPPIRNRVLALVRRGLCKEAEACSGRALHWLEFKGPRATLHYVSAFRPEFLKLRLCSLLVMREFYEVSNLFDQMDRNDRCNGGRRLFRDTEPVLYWCRALIAFDRGTKASNLFNATLRDRNGIDIDSYDRLISSYRVEDIEKGVRAADCALAGDQTDLVKLLWIGGNRRDALPSHDIHLIGADVAEALMKRISLGCQSDADGAALEGIADAMSRQGYEERSWLTLHRRWLAIRHFLDRGSDIERENLVEDVREAVRAAASDGDAQSTRMLSMALESPDSGWADQGEQSDGLALLEGVVDRYFPARDMISDTTSGKSA